MNKKNAKTSPIHPGQRLICELQERGISQKKFAVMMKMRAPHVSALVNGKRHISAPLALRLEKKLPIKALTWMTWQMEYDLAAAKRKVHVRRKIS
jgi:HTH-type transcriptional regulator/antitoxin HigA